MFPALKFGAILSYAWFTICNARILDTECVNVVGPNSGFGDDDYSSAVCAATYTLVSCGIDTTVTANIDGAKTVANEINECRAYIGSVNSAGQYVRAVARCCKLDSSATCTSSVGPKSGTGDDDTSTLTCQSNEILTGCSAYSPWRTIDGSHAGTQSTTWWDNTQPIWFERSDIDGSNPLQTCTAYNGHSGGGIYANGNCCSYTNNDIRLQCGVVEGIKSGVNDNDISEAVCPSGYSTFGCSSYTAWRGSKSWFISDENKCVARTANSGGVWPYAICCREIDSSCDESLLGESCDDDGDCSDCQQCCAKRKICENPPAAHAMLNINDNLGVEKKPFHKEPAYGYILMVGVILFILINNVFIGYWCVCRKDNPAVQYEKCEVINVNDE